MTFLIMKSKTLMASFTSNFGDTVLRILRPPVVTVFVSVFVFVADEVDGAETVFVTRTVTFVPPMVKVGEELPPKL
jgi:hypothetical protein